MKLWLLKQDTVTGCDTYDSCVVVADTEEQAKTMHPTPYEARQMTAGTGWDWPTSPKLVTATLLGEAADPTRRVVCSSFNVG
jgi:hypothetical protein